MHLSQILKASQNLEFTTPLLDYPFEERKLLWGVIEYSEVGTLPILQSRFRERRCQIDDIMESETIDLEKINNACFDLIQFSRWVRFYA